MLVLSTFVLPMANVAPPMFGKKLHPPNLNSEVLIVRHLSAARQPAMIPGEEQCRACHVQMQPVRVPKDSSKCLRIAATVKHHVRGLQFRNPTTFRLLLTLRFTFFLFTDYPSPVPAAAYAAAQDSPLHLDPVCEARATSCTSLSW